MVDFQARDTRRGLDDGDDEQEDDERKDDGMEDERRDDEVQEERGGDEQIDDEPAADPETERGVAVVSVARNRTFEEDAAGDAVAEEIDRGGGHVVTREMIDASYDGVQKAIDALAERRDVYAIITTGGTGVEADDVTIEAIQPMLDKELPGFGELFRRACHERVGSAVIRTRATAGIIDGVALFSLPGDPELARHGVRDIVVPEAEYLAALAEVDES